MARSFQNAHYALQVEDDPRVVKLVRTAEQFHSVGEMAGVLEEIFNAIGDVDGASYGLVVDGRKAPTRDDPAFQNAFRLFRTRLDERFVRVGVVLASAPTVERLEHAGTSPNVRIYTDEAAASQWAAHAAES